jgi:dCTP deaminase
MGCVLSDQDLRRRLAAGGGLVIEQLDGDSAIQPASVELRLDLSGGVLRPLYCETLRFSATERVEPQMALDACERGELVLHPGACALATTMERVKIPADLVAQVNGKSSLARAFLIVHTTAGFVDPGFEGQITLEIVNLSPQTVVLPDGLRVAQLVLMGLTSEALRPYGHKDLGSRYQHQEGATASRYGGER